MNTNRMRTRWAAIGAAVAVALGAGGIGIGHATTSTGEKPIYLPIEPCRLADTRPGFQVGPRATPLGAAETYDLSGWGAVGNCTLPNDTAGLALNVTAIDPDAPTFLTIFPDGVPLPLASNLNPTPGQPPTPNAVNVDLSAAGVFSVYNLAGNVHIAIDVVGIYDDHNHDDRYYTKAQVDGRTATKNISLPALALNENAGSGVIEHESTGLHWENNGTEAAEVFIKRPKDWTGQGDVVLRVFFRRTSNSIGRVQFFTRPRDYNDGDPFQDTGGIVSDVQTESNTDYYEVAMTISAAHLPKDWWQLVIQRNAGIAGAYTDPVVVHSVDVEYQATT